MGNAARKLSLIRWLSTVDDEATLEKLELIAKDSLRDQYYHYVQPQTKEELEQLVKESEEDYKAGRYITHDGLKKRFNLTPN